MVPLFVDCKKRELGLRIDNTDDCGSHGDAHIDCPMGENLLVEELLVGSPQMLHF